MVLLVSTFPLAFIQPANALIFLPMPFQNWTKSSSNPILVPGADWEDWDHFGVSRPVALMGDDGNLFLYYTGQRKSRPFTAGGIGLATSRLQYDRVVFTKYSGNPILTPGSPGSPDSEGALSPVVVHPPGGGYTMYYEGYDGIHRRILRATSAGDAYGPWVKQGVALDVGWPGSWDAVSVYHPTVIYEPGAGWRMWFAGYDGTRRCIGYAASPDGVSWTKLTGNLNPVFSPQFGAGTWDDYQVEDPAVVKIGGLYWMYYLGSGSGAPRSGIGSAYSENGYEWYRFGTIFGSPPMITPGASGDWDENIYAASVFPLWTWFWESSLCLGMYYSGGNWLNEAGGIGYAFVSFGASGSPLFLDASQGGTYFINGDPSVSQYTAYDSLSAGILYGLSKNPQAFGFDTSASWVTQTGPDKGRLLLDGKRVITMGGYGSNFVENYYENTAYETGHSCVKGYCGSPIHVRINTNTQAYEFYERRLSTVVASMPMSTDFTHNDLLVIMVVRPFDVPGGTGNDVLIIYGITWRGTWAGGIYYKDMFWGQLGLYGSHFFVGYDYIILQWTDTNGDTYPTSNELFPIAYGN